MRSAIAACLLASAVATAPFTVGGLQSRTGVAGACRGCWADVGLSGLQTRQRWFWGLFLGSWYNPPAHSRGDAFPVPLCHSLCSSEPGDL
jgi:hypothetical protein